MPEYLTPGVYVEEVSFRAPSIEGVGTSTTGFAGVALTGPIYTAPSPNPGQTPVQNPAPELLTSFGDFQNIYGSYDNLTLSGATYTNYLAMAVKAFFDNGGSQLYVSRVFVPNGGADMGIATGGTLAPANVAVTARFPGFSGNQQVTVNLKSARTQRIATLPTGSLVASAANTSSLANPVLANDSKITLNGPLPWGLPANVLVGSELMVVTGSDPTGTKLSVTRSASTPYNAGTAVLGRIGTLSGAGLGANATQLTLSAGGAALTTTAAPTTGTTPAASTTSSSTTSPAPTTTPAATTTAAPTPLAVSFGIPAFLQVDAEILTVTQVDSTGTVITVTRSTPSVVHTANTPVFAPIQVFSASNPSQFLTNTMPPGLYVLTMQVTCNSASGAPAVFDSLGFDPTHPYYLGTVLAAPPNVPPRHIDALQNQMGFIIGANLTPTSLFQVIFPSWGGPSAGASTVYNLTGGNDGQEPESTDYDNALSLFTSLEDIAIVGVPGSGVFDASQDIINSLITHVSQQRAYRVAILETPPNHLASDNEEVRATIDSSYAALYVPWVITPNPLATSGSAIAAEIAVPPTGFMAGIWARSDEQNGVSKAPANEVILGASRLERDISFAEQGLLNPLGINCLRYFPNRGFRVWGARTATSDSEFMYLNVRRYLIYLEHSIDNSTQWVVFENNGPALWSRVKEAIDSFLYSEFKAGNLLGDSASQAYFVRCDRTTMTQNDLDNGRMICLIGAAVLKPAEFVIFRIGQITALAQS